MSESVGANSHPAQKKLLPLHQVSSHLAPPLSWDVLSTHRLPPQRHAGAFPTGIVWMTFSAATSMTDTLSLSLLVT